MKKTQQKKIHANVTTLLMLQCKSSKCRKLFTIQNLIFNYQEFIKKKTLKTNTMMMILSDDILSLTYLMLCNSEVFHMDKGRFHPKLCFLDRI